MTDSKTIFSLIHNIDTKETKFKSFKLAKFCTRTTCSLENEDKGFIDIINIWREKTKKFKTASIIFVNEKDQIVGFLLAHVTEKDPLEKHKIPWILDIAYFKKQYRKYESYITLFTFFMKNFIKNEKGSGITTFRKNQEIDEYIEKLGFKMEIKSETGTNVPLTIYRLDVNI